MCEEGVRTETEEFALKMTLTIKYQNMKLLIVEY